MRQQIPAPVQRGGSAKQSNVKRYPLSAVHTGGKYHACDTF
jgi:hypothetical protein